GAKYDPRKDADNYKGTNYSGKIGLEQSYEAELHGLTGFDLHGKTVGVVGTGQIGVAFARIMAGFGCQLLAYDPYPNPELLALGARYLTLP
ncbi:NAD(P)-dependent oxidoreductase, partial [Paraburkholderia sp. SIMBA_050]